MAEVRAHFLPLAWARYLNQQAKPIGPFGQKPTVWPGPDICRTQGQIQIAIKENSRSLDVTRPTPQKINILPVVRLLEPLQIVPAKILAAESASFVADAASRLRQQ